MVSQTKDTEILEWRVGVPAKDFLCRKMRYCLQFHFQNCAPKDFKSLERGFGVAPKDFKS